MILFALAGYAALITLLCVFLLLMLAKARKAVSWKACPNCNRSVATAWRCTL